MRRRARTVAVLLGTALCFAVLGPVAAADTTPPPANQPFVTFRKGQVTSASTPAAKVLLQAFWTPSVDASGIASYAVQIRRNGSLTWTKVGTTKVAHINLSLQPYYGCGGCSDGRYTLRIQAKDRAGLRGPWRESNRFEIAQYQESHAGLELGSGWGPSTPLAGAYEGHVSRATTSNRTIKFQAGNAQRIAVVATRASGRGRLQVSIDSVVVGTFSLAGSSQLRRVFWVSGPLTYTVHQFVVKSLDNATVDFDAILTIGDV